MYYRYKEHIPKVDPSVFVAEGAKIIGNVTIKANSSIWFNVVIRGDEGPIKIGERCNVQENTLCHLYEEYPLTLEDDVSVGHNVILHGCTIRSGALIGMGSTVLDGAVIGENSIVGANSLIPPGKVIPANSLVLGSPGKVIRDITEADLEMIKITQETYVRNATDFQNNKIFEKIEL